jgi:hypothetical protein
MTNLKVLSCHSEKAVKIPVRQHAASILRSEMCMIWSGLVICCWPSAAQLLLVLGHVGPKMYFSASQF